MPLLNYTTKIPASETVGQIQSILAKHGASDVMISYRSNLPVSLTFAIETPKGIMQFRLPSRWEAVARILRNDPDVRPKYEGDEHACNVAWRILKDWAEAQLAIIDSDLADILDVMLPYALTGDGRTLADAMRDDPTRILALEAPHA